MVKSNESKLSLESLARAFEEYKATNDQLLRDLQKGKGDVLLDEKLSRMDNSINRIQDSLHSIKESLPQIQSTSSEELVSCKRIFENYVIRGCEVPPNFCSADQGGCIVPSSLYKSIEDRLTQLVPMRQVSTVVNISLGSLEVLRTPERPARWCDEKGLNEHNEKGSFRIRIPVHELYAQPKATQKTLSSLANIEDWFVSHLSDKFARSESNAFIIGDGIGQPRGILSYSTSMSKDSDRPWGVIENYITGTNKGFGSQGADVLIELMHKLKVGYLPRAKWLMPREVEDKVRKLNDPNTNTYIYQPSLQSEYPTLLGYPVVNVEDMPSLEAESFSLAFGNFEEAYTIVDKVGMNLLRDPYTASPFVKFRCSKHVGGDVTNFNAIKLLKFSAQ
jgi:HK97 family phage major capsid protein